MPRRGDADQRLAPGASRVTSAPLGKTAGQSRRTGGDPVDDRVELREYGFKDTGENLPYAVFVSSKVTRDKKAPLVLALHGFSGNHGTFMRTAAVDAAEEGGYILVGAMGYSPSGSFGMPFGGRGAAAGDPHRRQPQVRRQRLPPDVEAGALRSEEQRKPTRQRSPNSAREMRCTSWRWCARNSTWMIAAFT